MWYYSTSGTQRGPFTDKEFLREVHDGLVEPDTLVWNDELNEWREAQNVPGLLAPEDAAARPGASFREAAEYGMFRNERHWNDSDLPPPAGSKAEQESRYKDSPHYEPNPSLFSFRGRLGRLAHVLQSVAIMAAVFIVAGSLTALILTFETLFAPNGTLLVLSGIGALIGYVVAVFLLACISVKRLHDLNLSGWFYWVTLIPVANILFGLYMLFAPGTDGPNRYGPKSS